MLRGRGCRVNGVGGLDWSFLLFLQHSFLLLRGHFFRDQLIVAAGSGAGKVGRDTETPFVVVCGIVFDTVPVPSIILRKTIPVWY